MIVRRRAKALGCACMAALALAACNGLLDIEDRPLRDDEAGALGPDADGSVSDGTTSHADAALVDGGSDAASPALCRVPRAPSTDCMKDVSRCQITSLLAATPVDAADAVYDAGTLYSSGITADATHVYW